MSIKTHVYVPGYYITPAHGTGTPPLDSNEDMAARKTYCFTYNNYTPEIETRLQQFLTENTEYSIYGRETAPTTGTPHLQVLYI